MNTPPSKKNVEKDAARQPHSITSDTVRTDAARLNTIGYNDFREMAKNETLSRFEKIGFPNAYRAEKEHLIYADICTKLPALHKERACILDIGCGCSDLPRLLIEQAAQKLQQLLMLDSPEMLGHLPESAHGKKIAACFPDCPELFPAYENKCDAILVYSVIQYVFREANIFDFLDKALSLLAPQGRMLIGDIPNISMRKRFFASESGKAFHRAFTGRDEDPPIELNSLEPNQIDDSVIMSLLSQARGAGFHAFVVPQDDQLPMANRREDILILRP